MAPSVIRGRRPRVHGREQPGRGGVKGRMTFEAQTVLSTATLAVFIWVVRFLLPRAIRQHDPLALTCAVLTGILALLLWLLTGVGTRSF